MSLRLGGSGILSNGVSSRFGRKDVSPLINCRSEELSSRSISGGRGELGGEGGSPSVFTSLLTYKVTVPCARRRAAMASL